MKSNIMKLNPAIWGYDVWRKFFFVSAIWNLTGSIPSIIYPAFSMRLFYGIQTNNFHTLLLEVLFFGAVFIFGVGYLIVAFAPEKNLGILFLGLVSKVIIAIIWYYIFFFYDDCATFVVAVVATGDIIFSIYFGYYLTKGPRSR